jgi:hypothetical protein
LVYHVVKNGSDTSLSESWVSKTYDGVKILPKYAILSLNVAKLLIFDKQLRGRLAEFTTAYSEVIHEEVA